LVGGGRERERGGVLFRGLLPRRKKKKKKAEPSRRAVFFSVFPSAAPDPPYARPLYPPLS